MKVLTLAGTKPIGLGLAALAAAALAPSAAQAQSGIVFTGDAQACFYADPASTCTPQQAFPFYGLTYTSDPVDGALPDFRAETDENGFAAIGGTGNNYGEVELDYPPEESYSDSFFRLQLTFFQPTVTSGNPATFSAFLQGRVAAEGSGINFFFTDNSEAIEFTLADGRTGTGEVFVNNFGVNANEDVQPISGYIQVNSVVPEPASMALLATGLLGLAGVARRRRRNSIEE